MKLSKVLATLAIMLAIGRMTPAQSGKSSHPDDIAQVLDSWISNAEKHVMPVAEAMPAEKYSFAPAESGGEFRGVRTFAQQLKHLAANNYWMAALILEKKASAEMHNETGPDSVQSRAEIIEYVKGSFAALHQAVTTIDAKNATAPVESAISWQRTRLSFAVDAVAHSFDHYGQLVEYLRMNGIVPPASRPKKDETAFIEEVP
jgi:uncharacterized damage-inducible protein DinB